MPTTVFLSYSQKDHFFAELADIKLSEAGIKLWRDRGQLRPGSDWRLGIEAGIAESVAVLVALSTNSVETSYVTFEWAYAFGKGKAVIPLKLNECTIHPKLAAIQHLDFSIPGALPWDSLIERVQEIETDAEPTGPTPDAPPPPSAPQDGLAKSILAYLDQRGYQMASFERLRRRIDENLTDEQFNDLIAKNPTVFRRAVLKDGKPGIAKLIP
jgi:TIR domain-containing protein